MGISNIVARRGNARRLPYPNGYYHAAYLGTTLGEVPDKRRAIAELRCILGRDGRLVVGEVLLDPYRVFVREHCRLADAAGLGHERTLEGALLGISPTSGIFVVLLDARILLRLENAADLARRQKTLP